MMFSTNNKIMVSPYKPEKKLRSKGTGFVTIDQKENIVQLNVLYDAKLVNGEVIKAGSKVFVKEDFLSVQQASLRVFSIGDSKDEFMLIEYENIIGVSA
jgi:hypothetical protein